MSISFTAHDTPKGPDKVYDCCDHPECPHCKGAGEVRFTTYLYDLNMANARAHQYVVLIAYDNRFDYCGSIDWPDVPRVLDVLRAYLKDNPLDEYAQKLHEIFTWAYANGKYVTWG